MKMLMKLVTVMYALVVYGRAERWRMLLRVNNVHDVGRVVDTSNTAIDLRSGAADSARLTPVSVRR